MKNIMILIMGLLSFDSLAHSGRTDSSGGHNCSAKSVSKGLCSGYHNHNSGNVPKTITPKYKKSYSTKYNRKDWPHWIDYDNDCQNARAEILIRDSIAPVKFKRNKGCNVTWGKWLDPYTLQTFTKASDIDIDHIIPLAHAHKSGAKNWSRSQKRSFANDPENLLAVEDNANQQKSAKAPHEWMPNNKKYHCIYLRKWQKLKDKYKLTATNSEQYFIANKLKNCS
jgi:hypothetical protein